MEAYREAARRFATIEDRSGEILSRSNLRHLFFRQGDLASAESELEAVALLADASQDPLLKASSWILEGRHLQELGEDLGRADRVLRKAQSAVIPNGPYDLKRECLLYLGNVAFDMARYAQSVGYYERLRPLAEESDDLTTLAAVDHNITNARRRQSEFLPRAGGREELLRLALQALPTAEASHHREAEAMTHRMVGDLLSITDTEKSRARFHYERCLDVAKKNHIPEETGACLWALGRFLVEEDPQNAGDLIDEALAVALRTGTSSAIVLAWRERMRLSWRTFSKERALSDSLSALDAIETDRELQTDRGSRAEVFSTWAQDYYFLSGQLLQASEGSPSTEEIDLAFFTIERLRSRVLLEGLSSAKARPAPNPWQEKRRREALQRIATLQRRLLDPRLIGNERTEALRELEQNEIEYEDIESLLEREDPSYQHRKPSFASLREVEQNLQPNEALLSFQVSLWKDIYETFRGGAWLFAVTRGGTRVFSLPDRARLAPAVSVFIGLVDRRDGTEASPAARLYQPLFQEALRSLPPEVDHLILVPDDALHRLPFGAVRASADAEPLASKYELTVVPSATLWWRWRQSKPRVASASALVLADPFLANAPESPEIAEEREWPWALGAPLGSLPHARREARATTRHLGGASQLLLGAEATERFIKTSDLSEFGILHFAAHAIVEEDNPDRSAVLLAPGAEGEDGLLQVREIVGLDLRDKVVVLSACRTASGAVLSGEGVMSLARGFFQAGARVVVGSLWPVRDDEAAVLFDAFYRHLGKGMSVSAALAAAQREGMRAGLPAAAWASLVALGDAALVPLPGGRSESSWKSWTAIAGVGTLALIVALAISRARRRRAPGVRP